MAIFQGKKVFVVVPCGFFLFFFFSPGTNLIHSIHRKGFPGNFHSELENGQRDAKWEQGRMLMKTEFSQPVVRFLYWQWPGISPNRSLQKSASLVFHCLRPLTTMAWRLCLIIWAIKPLFLPVNMEIQVCLFSLCLSHWTWFSPSNINGLTYKETNSSKSLLYSCCLQPLLEVSLCMASRIKVRYRRSSSSKPFSEFFFK